VAMPCLLNTWCLPFHNKAFIHQYVIDFCKNLYFSEGFSTVKVLVNLPISVVPTAYPITRKSRRLAKLSYSFLFVQEIDVLPVLARGGWFNSLSMPYIYSLYISSM
jgi:hypothetical protein